LDFLLECIGFPPDFDHRELPDLVQRFGEAAPWRDPAGSHRRLALGGGLELRLDHDLGQGTPTVWPYFAAAERLRIEVDSLERVSDAPYDALLRGWANPPGATDAAGEREPSYAFATWLSDRRRLPRTLRRGRVLAVAVAGFALDITAVTEAPGRASIEPLGGPEDPGGCVELELPIRAVESLANPLTGAVVERLTLGAPGRSFSVFASRWQLASDQLPEPRPGAWLRGTFLFNGRVTGGLPSASRHLGRSFG
jgi:hypothetical protein